MNLKNIRTLPKPLPVRPEEAVTLSQPTHTSIEIHSGPPCFLPEKGNSSDFARYILPKTTGLVTPLINGRSSGGTGPDTDLAEPLLEMENLIRNLIVGDFVYLAAWFFEPLTELVSGTDYNGATTWGELFAEKAKENVRIRILINDFDPVSGMDSWLQNNSLNPLTAIINSMPQKQREYFMFNVSKHPAYVGTLKSLLAGQFSNIHIASHHQKFMVVKKGNEITAFCGGLDIESRKTPSQWSYSGLIGWHDIHFKLEGKIAYNLQQEFINRWNIEFNNGSPKNPSIVGWHKSETLVPIVPGTSDNAPAKNIHEVQMLVTKSVNATYSPYENIRDDILTVYTNVVHESKDFLYFENQYFRDQTLADKIAGRARANTNLKAIFVVVASAADDDGDNIVTKHGNYLQYQFFKKVSDSFGNRVRIYTMTGRAVHSKLLISDNDIIVGGSANANTRSFKLDSELNISVFSQPLATSFRNRLWSHNLGTTEADVSSWTDYLKEWDSVATHNAGISSDEDMKGEGVVKFDYTISKGEESWIIDDAIAHLDFEKRKDPFGEELGTQIG